MSAAIGRASSSLLPPRLNFAVETLLQPCLLQPCLFVTEGGKEVQTLPCSGPVGF